MESFLLLRASRRLSRYFHPASSRRIESFSSPLCLPKAHFDNHCYHQHDLFVSTVGIPSVFVNSLWFQSVHSTTKRNENQGNEGINISFAKSFGVKRIAEVASAKRLDEKKIKNVYRFQNRREMSTEGETCEHGDHHYYWN